jgi:hypothetical protein
MTDDRNAEPGWSGHATAPLPPVATVPVSAAAIALLIVLCAFAAQYGFDRDELYFRMLPPAWGYVDQPPLTPLLTRLLTQWIADAPWASRLPAILFAVASVPVIALITREAGGGRLAQGLAAWGYAFGSMTLTMGHVFLTASADLLVWPLVSLLVIRAVMRDEQRWWIWAGIAVGLSTYNKLLVALLLVSLAAGLVAVGPRHVFKSRGLWLGVGLAVLIAAPNFVYQATNGWPQLQMGAALSAKNASSVRIVMWPMLLLMLGPLLVPVWAAGLIGLARRAGWRRLRFLLVAFPVLLGLVWLSGGQFYYPYGLLSVIYGLGCVPAAQFAARRPVWKSLVIGAVAVNSAVSAVISLPIIPLTLLGATPIPAINALTGDQVGWVTYADEIDRAAASASKGVDTAILTSNYGEAGALSRFGRSALAVYSGHNELYRSGPPPDTVTQVVVVGRMLTRLTPFFADCAIKSHLDNGVGVPNEEQGQPVAICRGRTQPWAAIWPTLKHLD